MKFPGIKGHPRIGICSIDKVDYDRVSAQNWRRGAEGPGDSLMAPVDVYTRAERAMHVHASAASFCALMAALDLRCVHVRSRVISPRVRTLPSMDIHC